MAHARTVMHAPALSVEHLSKRFGDRVAFEDVCFAVGQGEVFGFLGPNGAGKTTMVRTLGTLLLPSAGTAFIAGIPLSPANGVEIRRRIAVMPESPGLYLRLSVAENLACFADLYEVPDPTDRIGRALGAVQLADRAQEACGTLSKGLRQRVALARALLNDPQVLFLDEPTAGLDPVASREVHQLLTTLSRGGVTIFLTTHRLEEAERLCDRVAILNTTLRTIGRPAQLREQLFAPTLTVRTLAALSDPGRGLCWPAGRRRLAPGRPHQLCPGRVGPGGRRPRRHPGAGRGRGRGAVDRPVPALAGGGLPGADRPRPGGGPQMNVSSRRVRAIVRKELREYRHNGFIIWTMAIFPLIFLIQPLVVVFALPPRPRPGSATSTCCCTCWASRRSCRPRSPPMRWSASASRAPWSRC
jgi:ABC-2 type transport system ATP-binding protein